MKPFFKTELSATLLAILLLGGVSSRADEKTWTGTLDGSWANNGNWSPEALVTGVDGVLYDSSSVNSD